MTGEAEVISHDVHRAHILEECLCGRGCQRRIQLEGKPSAKFRNDLMTPMITDYSIIIVTIMVLSSVVIL